ncbi:TPA: phosphate acyltransferase PlsX [Candidatus Galligastranaerophilus gallistercoris]|nr:phosphate acyltransferase PlsX [Candidatus Galligastranaerophilus gallistercoris]
MTRIAIDAMGGDYAPAAIVDGAVWAARDYNIPIELVGKEDEIKRELDRIAKKGISSNRGGYYTHKIKVDLSKLDIKITNAEEVIEMGEAVGQAIRKKKKSSIVLAVDAVAKGSSDAVVAAGSTGAAMASSLFGLGRLTGIERPAIALTLPTIKKPFMLLDAGANSSCSPEMLYQFALMGSTFVKNVYGYENPRVGVLNIGEEAGKGNELVQTAYKLLEENKDGLNFIGNVEGKEIFKGSCDVIVCDGFVGNVALKMIEGSSSMLFEMIKQEFCSNIISMAIGLLAKPFMKRIYKRINYEEFGGALLLGVKGITVISHGRSTSYAIRNAVRVAKDAVESGVNKKISEFFQ